MADRKRKHLLDALGQPQNAVRLISAVCIVYGGVEIIRSVVGAWLDSGPATSVVWAVLARGVEISIGIGLLRKNRPALVGAIMLTILEGIAICAAATVWLLAMQLTDQSAWFAVLVEVLVAVAVAASLSAILLQRWEVLTRYAWSLSMRWANAIRAAAILGACEGIVLAVWPTLPNTLLTVPPSAALTALIPVALVPGIAYVFWSYGALRSGPVERWFDAI